MTDYLAKKFQKVTAESLEKLTKFAKAQSTAYSHVYQTRGCKETLFIISYCEYQLH